MESSTDGRTERRRKARRERREESEGKETETERRGLLKRGERRRGWKGELESQNEGGIDKRNLESGKRSTLTWSKREHRLLLVGIIDQIPEKKEIFCVKFIDSGSSFVC